MPNLFSSRGFAPPEDEPSICALSTKQKQKCAWTLASWNVRSLVDIEGLIETARQRSKFMDAGDRRINQELEKYKIKVAAIQESNGSVMRFIV